MTLFKEFSHSHRTLPWLLKIRSSEVHQQTYHHAVVLLLSRFLQNTAKEFEVIQILFYHMDKIFPAGKGRHKMTDLKHKVTPMSKGPAPWKKNPPKPNNKQTTPKPIYRSSLQLQELPCRAQKHALRWHPADPHPGSMDLHSFLTEELHKPQWNSASTEPRKWAGYVGLEITAHSP